MIVPICQWGSERHLPSALSIVELAADYSTLGIIYLSDAWKNIRLFPALLLIYAGGLAAVSSENYQILAGILNKARYYDHEGEKLLSSILTPHEVFGHDLGQADPKYRTFQGTSVYLSATLRPLFRDTIPQQVRYDSVFDRFEYLYLLVHADRYEKRTQEHGIWNYPLKHGWFVVRNRHSPQDITAIVQREIEKSGTSWPPLQAGMFRGLCISPTCRSLATKRVDVWDGPKVKDDFVSKSNAARYCTLVLLVSGSSSL